MHGGKEEMYQQFYLKNIKTDPLENICGEERITSKLILKKQFAKV
jgi:hypothetical protein